MGKSSRKQGSNQKKAMGEQHHHGREASSRERLHTCTHVLTSFLPGRQSLQQPHSSQRNCLQGKIKSYQQRPVQVHIHCEKTVLTWPLVKIFHLLRLSPIIEGSYGCFHFNISTLITIGREKRQRTQQHFKCEVAIFRFSRTAARWLNRHISIGNQWPNDYHAFWICCGIYNYVEVKIRGCQLL